MYFSHFGLDLLLYLNLLSHKKTGKSYLHILKFKKGLQPSLHIDQIASYIYI